MSRGSLDHKLKNPDLDDDPKTSVLILFQKSSVKVSKVEHRESSIQIKASGHKSN